MTYSQMTFKKSVLITGAAGFIGSWLSQYLVNLGHHVLGVDNLISGKLENISTILQSKKMIFIRQDVAADNFVSNFSPEMEINQIFHLASPASPLEFKKIPIKILKANILGTFNVVELARKTDARIIYASSSEVYGDPTIDGLIPTPESYVPRLSHLGDRSCYDEGKRAAETILMAACEEYGIDVRIARIFNTYGPRMQYGPIRGRVIPNFIVQALTGAPLTIYGDGSQTRAFMYITDLIDGLIKFSQHGNSKGRIINLGHYEEMTIIQLAHLIKNLINSSSEIVFVPFPTRNDPMRRCPDISIARELLQWEPVVRIEEGLKRTISYYKKATRGMTSKTI